MVLSHGDREGDSSGRQPGLAGGTILVMAAEALAFPAGLIATILLTRHFPAADYGALALALAGTAWLEWTIVSLFSRAAWKLIAESEHWREVATAVVRTYLAGSLPVSLVVLLTADLVASALRIPLLAPVLRVLAVEISLFVAVHAYRTVLIGRGLHRARATVTAVRWIARALLIALGVVLGVSVTGIAILITGATALELVVVRWQAGRAFRAADVTISSHESIRGLTVRGLMAYAAPLVVSAICLRLFDRMDIFALRILGGSIESVAAYGVAQNLALGPGLFGSAFTPALIAAMSQRLAYGDGAGARQLSTDALRAGFLTIPLILLVAGAAPQLIALMFGDGYAAAAPLFTLLLVGAAGTLLIALAGGLLVSAGKLRVTALLTAPLLLIAFVGHVLVVPTFGAIGAAAVTAGTAIVGAIASCAVAGRVLQTGVPMVTLLRGVLLGGAAGWIAARLPMTGFVMLAGLAGLTIALVVAVCLTGELRSDERAFLRHWSRSLWRPASLPR